VECALYPVVQLHFQLALINEKMLTKRELSLLAAAFCFIAEGW